MIVLIIRGRGSFADGGKPQTMRSADGLRQDPIGKRLPRYQHSGLVYALPHDFNKRNESLSLSLSLPLSLPLFRTLDQCSDLWASSGKAATSSGSAQGSLRTECHTHTVTYADAYTYTCRLCTPACECTPLHSLWATPLAADRCPRVPLPVHLRNI